MSVDPDRPSLVEARVLPPRMRQIAAWSAALILAAAATAVIIVTLVGLRVVVLPVLIALLSTALVGPFARRLQHLGVPSTVCALAAILLLLAVLLGAASILINALVGTSDDIGTALRAGAVKVDGYLAGLPTPAGDGQPRLIENAATGLITTAGTLLSALANGVISGVAIAAQLIGGLVLILTLVFFFIRDGHRLWHPVTTTLPVAARVHVEQIARHAFAALSSYIRGTTTIALVDSVLILIALLIIGVPGAPGLAALVFIGAYVPYIGAFLSGTVAVLVALADRGVAAALWVLVAVLLVQALEGWLLQPWIQSRSVALHPVVVVLAITAGMSVGGTVGALLAVPIAAVIVATARLLATPPTEPDDAREPEGPQASTLTSPRQVT